MCAIGFRLVGKVGATRPAACVCVALNSFHGRQNTSNKMFVLFEFRKRGRPATDAAPHVPALKPCLYKRR